MRRGVRFGLKVFFIIFVLALSGVASAAPQATTGTIDGAVADQTGAVLPNVEVTLKNVETGVTRTVVTDDRGSFRALLLPVGRYDVSVDFKGFSPFRQPGIVLTVGQTATLNIRLSVTDASQLDGR